MEYRRRIMATKEDFLKCSKWVKRVREIFRVLDVDNKGYVTEEDYMRPINELAKIITDRPELFAKARKARLELTKAMGITGSAKVDQQKFLELGATYVAFERARIEKGETPYLEVSKNTILDILDRNRDGMVTWDEFNTCVSVSNIGEEFTKAVFALLDKDKNGKLSISEYLKCDIKFWFECDNPEVRGLYGDRFE